jgi:T1SS-143 domain-containing protein
VAVTYAVAGNVLTASAGGATVFTFSVNATTGAYTFTLVDQLDHAPGLNENNLTIALGTIIQATDFDGDTVTAGANGVVITVNDDTPIATTATFTGTVDEDGVAGGIAGGTGDVAGEATVATGNVSTLFQSGADSPLTYSLTNATAGLPALTSGGVAVTYAVAGNVLTASAGGATVFTFSVNATTGAYTFTLVDQLDHAPGLNENNLTINLGTIIQATDFDGDTVTAGANGVVITVNDDTPIATTCDVHRDGG